MPSVNSLFLAMFVILGFAFITSCMGIYELTHDDEHTKAFLVCAFCFLALSFGFGIAANRKQTENYNHKIARIQPKLQTVNDTIYADIDTMHKNTKNSITYRKAQSDYYHQIEQQKQLQQKIKHYQDKKTKSDV